MGDENGTPVTARELYRSVGTILVILFGMVMWLHNEQAGDIHEIETQLEGRLTRATTRSQDANKTLRGDASKALTGLENDFEQWRLSVAPLDVEQSMLGWQNCQRISTLTAAMISQHSELDISGGVNCPPPAKRVIE